jgi:L-ascorbate metabolism protein UlaG (beta-lactamase superfamily)
MMSWEHALIQEENQNGPKFVLVTDDHSLHLKGHLRSIHKPGMIKHLFQHLMLYVRAKSLGLPKLSLDEIIKAQNKRDS